MAELEKRTIGETGLEVTPLCIGGGPISSLPQVFGYAVSPEQAIATVRQAFSSPITFIDTAAAYGNGSVERVIGIVIAEMGGVPEGRLVGTKADPDPTTWDFSGEQARRSVQGSLGRLGIDHLPLVFLHEVERCSFEQVMGKNGALQELRRFRDEGLIGHLGVAAGPVDVLRRYLGTGAFEVVLTHNRYTLVNRSAASVIQQATDAGVGVINAAVYGGGVLAKGTTVMTKYAYAQADKDLLEQIRAMESSCRLYEVPLKAAALQFSTKDPRIASTIVGVSDPRHVDETVALFETAIPAALWNELEALVPNESTWLR